MSRSASIWLRQIVGWSWGDCLKWGSKNGLCLPWCSWDHITIALLYADKPSSMSLCQLEGREGGKIFQVLGNGEYARTIVLVVVVHTMMHDGTWKELADRKRKLEAPAG